MNYDINYFITKFSSIPEENWCTLQLDNNAGAHCAMGHTGCSTTVIHGRMDSNTTEEGWALAKIFGSVANVMNVNDIWQMGLPVSPKERILDHLKKLKEKEEKENLIKFAENLVSEEEVLELV